MDKSIQDKIQKRINANRIVGLMRFRDSFGSAKDKHSWNLCGHPMYYWKMKAALETKHLEKIIVWTDNKEAQGMAGKWSDKFIVIRGNKDEFKDPRVKRLDNLKTPESIIPRARVFFDLADPLHVTPEVIKQIGFKPTLSVLLCVNTPLETAESIDKLIEKYFEDDNAEEAHLVYQGNPFVLIHNPRHPQYLLAVNDWQTQAGRQNLPIMYCPSGTVILSYPWTRLRRKVFVEIPEAEGKEIHTKDDLEFAEFYMKKRLEKNKNV